MWLTGPHNSTAGMRDEVDTSTLQPVVAASGWRHSSPWQRRGRLYNVSNFGDTNACYADVNAGDELVFFLTVFNDRLSAKYDDLFGAVAERTRDNENEILRSLGRHHAPV